MAFQPKNLFLCAGIASRKGNGHFNANVLLDSFYFGANFASKDLTALFGIIL